MRAWREALSITADLIQVGQGIAAVGFFGLVAWLAKIPALNILIVGITIFVGVYLVIVIYRLTYALIPLNLAARVAYEKLRGTFPVMWADKDKNTPEEKLHFLAYYVAHNAPLWGQRPPSRIMERIPEDTLKGNGISNDCASLEPYGGDQPSYTSLMVRAKDLRKAICLIKKQDKEYRKTKNQKVE